MNDPRIKIQTELGDITLELYPRQAPITVANFLRYVEENRFLNAGCFYRVVCMDNQPNNEIKIEVIQGGLKDDEHPNRLPAIPHESTEQTGIHHKDGTISMARNEPGTADSEFFICVDDQPDLDFGGKRNLDGQGFAAFGRVIDGMSVVRNIHGQPADEQSLMPAIMIQAIRRV